MDEVHKSEAITGGSCSENERGGSDSDATDYEPESKKCRLEEDVSFSSIDKELVEVVTQTVGGRGVTNGGRSSTSTCDDDDEGVDEVAPKPGPVDVEVAQSPQQPSSSVRPAVSVEMMRVNRLIRSDSNLTVTNPRRSRQRRRRREMTRSQDLETSGDDSDTSNYLSESGDIDPMEIPSDEYLSPPTPPPRFHNRQRRNAIFERRDPPLPRAVQNEDDLYFHNEFEVASVSDINENPIEDANSTSGAEDDASPNPSAVVEIHNDDSDNKLVEETDNNFADIETLRSDVDSDDTNPSSNKSRRLNSSDSELSDKDKWFCSQCNAKSLPYFRYCLRCFKIRRNWLPKRPASRRLKSRKTAQRNLQNASRTTRSSCASDGEDVVDSGRARLPPVSGGNHQVASSVTVDEEDIRPCSSSQVQSNLSGAAPIDLDQGFLVDPPANRISCHTRMSQRGRRGTTMMLSQLFVAPDVPSKSSQSLNSNSDTGVDVPGPSSNALQSSVSALTYSQNSTATQSSSSSQFTSQSTSTDFGGSPSFSQDTDVKSDVHTGSQLQALCTICYVRNKDAAFVHNKIAHHYCCFTCADKILKKDGKCPICRERVHRVVKIISV